jgi:hypothetical protein
MPKVSVFSGTGLKKPNSIRTPVLLSREIDSSGVLVVRWILFTTSQCWKPDAAPDVLLNYCLMLAQMYLLVICRPQLKRIMQTTVRGKSILSVRPTY